MMVQVLFGGGLLAPAQSTKSIGRIPGNPQSQSRTERSGHLLAKAEQKENFVAKAERTLASNALLNNNKNKIARVL
jgi:hypothetical protein